MLVNVVCQTRIDQCDDAVQDVVFKRGTNDFILSKHLVVVPLNRLASSRCVVYYVSAVNPAGVMVSGSYWILERFRKWIPL